MSVLVTGGAGYIGSHMVLDLVSHGERVVVLDNLSTGHADVVSPDATLVVGEVADQDLVDRLCTEHGIRSIFHFAGSIVVPESVAQPLSYYRNNTEGSRALIESAVRNGVDHFIFSSTAAVYGTPDVVPIHEGAPCLPESPYGWSKLMVEQILSDVAKAHGLNVGILRYFNVAGADRLGRTGQMTENATHLIKVACEVALGRRDVLEIYGSDYGTRDGTCVRDFIHVSDLVTAHRLMLERLRRVGGFGLYNLGYGKGTTVAEIAKAVGAAAGIAVPVRYVARRPGDIAEVVADSSLARQELGWIPEFDDVDVIVRSAFEFESARLMRQTAETLGS